MHDLIPWPPEGDAVGSGIFGQKDGGGDDCLSTKSVINLIQGFGNCPRFFDFLEY